MGQQIRALKIVILDLKHKNRQFMPAIRKLIIINPPNQMPPITETKLIRFLPQLPISPTPQNITAQQYSQFFSTQDLQLQYCRLYLYYIGLSQMAAEEVKDVQELRKVIETREEMRRGHDGSISNVYVKNNTFKTIGGRQESRDQEHNGWEKQSCQSLKLVLKQVQHHNEHKKQQNSSHHDNQAFDRIPPDHTNAQEIFQTPPLAIRSKRNRRPTQQLRYQWQCPLKSCDKKYASQGSLKQHMKTKHRSFMVKGQFLESEEDSLLLRPRKYQIDRIGLGMKHFWEREGDKIQEEV